MKSDWRPPIPLAEHDVPEFPVERLPRALRGYVKSLSESLQVPVDMPAMLSLSIISASIANRYVVSPMPGWVEPLNSFIVVIMPPAERKSAVFLMMTKPLRQYEKKLVVREVPGIEEAKQKYRIMETALKRAEDRASKAKPHERQAAILEAAELMKQLPTIPKLPRLICDDVSPEKLSDMLAENGGRIALLSPEGGVFDMMSGRYSGLPNLDVYLKGHAGDSIHVDRVNRDSSSIDSPALTIGLAVQPDVIRGLASEPRFRGRGLIGRFWYSLPTSKVGYREVVTSPVDSFLEASYDHIVSSLSALSGTPRTDSNQPIVETLKLSKEAFECFVDYGKDIEHWLAPGGQFQYARDWGGKLLGAVARIAGILHAATYPEDPANKPIDEETMMSSILVGDYLRAHALAALDLMGADPTVDDARHVLEWIKRENFESFSARDAHQSMKGRFKRRKSIDPALNMLVDHGYLTYAPKPEYSGPGRKPSTVFNVNPLYLSQNSHNAQIGTSINNSEDIENTVTSNGSIRRVI